MEMTHYTTRRKWGKIRRAGFLEPKSSFIKDWIEEEMTKSMPELHSLRERKFIVAAPSSRVDDWKRYDLFDTLIDYTSGQARLTFNLENTEGVWVREHYFASGDYSVQKYGTDVFSARLHPILERWGIYRKERETLFKEYMLSSKKLSEANLSEIKVPEIWIPYPIAVDKITAEVEPGLVERILKPVFA